MKSASEFALLRSHSYVNGGWVEATGGERFPVFNPATGETIATVADLDVAQVNLALEAAYKAQKSWAKAGVKERARLLRR